jgi:hypothetical protein
VFTIGIATRTRGAQQYPKGRLSQFFLIGVHWTQRKTPARPDTIFEAKMTNQVKRRGQPSAILRSDTANPVLASVVDMISRVEATVERRAKSRVVPGLRFVICLPRP